MGQTRPPGVGRPALTLIVAVLGYGLNYWTWMLVGPIGLQLAYRYGLAPAAWSLLGIVSIATGILLRIPAGVLTDRFGARFVLPAISIAAALAVLLLASVGTVPALIAVACAIGIAGAAFPAGAGAVLRAFPPGRRGSALSVFAASMCLAVAGGIASRPLMTVGRPQGMLILAAGLLGYAVLALALLRDRPGPRQHPAAAPPTALTLLRRPATRYLTVWYGVSSGGIITLDVYLPSYLQRVYGIAWNSAQICAAAVVVVSAGGGLFGGWLCRRHAPTTVLGSCFTALAVLLLVLAFEPPLPWVAAPSLVGVAIALGTAFGSVLTLIGRTAPPAHAGLIAGLISAAGSAVGVLPTLLLTAVDGVDGTGPIGLMLLAGAAVAGAGSLRARRTWIGAAVAFPAPAVVASQAATTVVSLTARQIRPFLGDVTAVLAALATRHELVVVHADPNPAARPGTGHPIVAGLRRSLPGHTVLAIVTDTPPHPHEIAAIAEMLAAGTIPVVLVTGADPVPVAVILATAVHADQVLHLTPDRIEGLIPQQRLPQPVAARLAR